MIRGINRQLIFEDTKDAEKYLELLRTYQKRCGFALYGYCLMGNHVHLLIREAAHPSVLTINGKDVESGPGEYLNQIIKRIGVSYAAYFNRKYKRTGHLFQDRFKSEPIENDAYLLMALRYIHQNPVKAGLCARPEEYRLSSYSDYLYDGSEAKLTETDLVLSMITRENLIKYTSQTNNDQFIDLKNEEKLTRTDNEAKEHMLRISGCASASDFQRLDKSARENCMRKLYSEGFNVTQISKITGFSRMVIYRALNS